MAQKCIVRIMTGNLCLWDSSVNKCVNSKTIYYTVRFYQVKMKTGRQPQQYGVLFKALQIVG